MRASVVTRVDDPAVLEPAEHVLDFVTLAVEGALKSKVIFCVQGVISPILANIYLLSVRSMGPSGGVAPRRWAM